MRNISGRYLHRTAGKLPDSEENLQTVKGSKTVKKIHGQRGESMGKETAEDQGRTPGRRKEYEIGRTRSGLRLGFTTGSCAAAAAKAGVQMLLSGDEVRQVRLMTPKGIELYLDVEEIRRGPGSVRCGVRKYSGDDPDVTDGLLICAEVKKEEPEAPLLALTGSEQEDRIRISGGEGVGRVTRPGLEQPVGEAAVNKIPRQMIREAVREICDKYGYSGGVHVTLTIPGGDRVAEKTFNPRLGILGGLSILGTTGIVEPMSEKALTDTICLEMQVLKENGHDYCIVTPGNYGSDFLKEKMDMDLSLAVKCSNYIGEAIDDASMLGMKGILLVGHVGKLVKLAAGVMNTHSRQADCRMEVLASHAAMAGADRDTVTRIMGCINTTEAIRILKERELLVPVMGTVTERIREALRRRAGENLSVGAVMFSTEDGILGKTEEADVLLEQIRRGRSETRQKACSETRQKTRPEA